VIPNCERTGESKEKTLEDKNKEEIELRLQEPKMLSTNKRSVPVWLTFC